LLLSPNFFSDPALTIRLTPRSLRSNLGSKSLQSGSPRALMPQNGAKKIPPLKPNPKSSILDDETRSIDGDFNEIKTLQEDLERYSVFRHLNRFVFIRGVPKRV
jgi:hypothetical protein